MVSGGGDGGSGIIGWNCKGQASEGKWWKMMQSQRKPYLSLSLWLSLHRISFSLEICFSTHICNSFDVFLRGTTGMVFSMPTEKRHERERNHIHFFFVRLRFFPVMPLLLLLWMPTILFTIITTLSIKSPCARVSLWTLLFRLLPTPSSRSCARLWFIRYHDSMSMEFELSRLSVKYKSFHNLPQYLEHCTCNMYVWIDRKCISVSTTCYLYIDI